MIIITGLNKLLGNKHILNSIKRIKATSDYLKTVVVYNRQSLTLTPYLAIIPHLSSIMKMHKYSITLDLYDKTLYKMMIPFKR